MLYQSTVHPGGWFRLAEMAACLRLLFFSTLCSSPTPASSSPFHCCLALCSVLPPSPPHSPPLTSKDQCHSTTRFMRLDCKLVELSCQEDFFLALCEFDLFPYWRKAVELVSVQLSLRLSRSLSFLPARFG